MKYIFIVLLAFLSGRAAAQYDSIAVSILDSMSMEIGELESCSFRFFTEFDISNDEYGLITHTESGTAYMKAPDKLYIEKKGDKGHKSFYYNGNSFSIYSFDKNQYASVPVSLSIVELIDSLSSHYGVDFPGADLFYPDFTDNLLETSNNLIYLGQNFIGDTECYHVAGARDDMTYQLWVTSGENSLPKKMSLVYISKPDNPKYSIIFADWKLNENIDDSKFEFTIPADARLIKLIK